MNDLVVKPVDVLGSTIIAAQGKNGEIYAGVSYFCNALGMSRVQKDTQVDKIRTDKTLSKGYRKFPVGVFDQNNEVVGIRLDFIPIWLAKISVTERMEKEHPELADKLLEYQLKAKDILAEAFLPKQNNVSQLTLQQQVQVIAQGTSELYQRVDDLEKNLNDFKNDMPILGIEEVKITNAVRKKGVACLGGKESNAYKNRSLRGKLYADLYGQLRREFDVSTYKAIKRNQTDIALTIVLNYQPPMALSQEIDAENAQIQLDI